MWLSESWDPANANTHSDRQLGRLMNIECYSNMMRKDPFIDHVREWFKRADDQEIAEFLDSGLKDLIEELESEDYFGTEGFNKRFG